MIFSKTNLGRAAAFDPQSNLSLVQRTLLRKIDGKTPLTALSDAMAPSTCSVELIAALLNQHFILLTEESESHNAPSSGWPESDNGSNSSFYGSESARHLTCAQSGYDVTMPAQLVPLSFKNPKQESRFTERRESAKECMSTFVITYLPQHAEALLRNIRGIANSQQLASTLDMVSSLSNRSEAVNPAHMKELRQTVRHLLSD